MKLNIKLVNKEQFFCMEKVIASVSSYFGKSYEMIFANMIKSYNCNTAEELVKRIIQTSPYNEEEMLNYLGVFHNIKCEKPIINKKEAINYIKMELQHGNPIMVKIDILYQSWIKYKDYLYYLHKRKNGSLDKGILLISGFDNKCFDCIDVHYSHDQKNISFISIERGIDLSSLRIFKVQDTNLNIFKCQQFINKKIYSLFLPNDYGLNMFRQIKILAENLGKFEVFMGDFERYGYRQLFFLRDSLNELYRERYLFSITLEYLARKIYNKNMQSLCNQYKEVVSIWYLAFLITLKADIQKQYSKSDLAQLKTMIIKANDYEEAVMQSLLDLNISKKVIKNHSIKQRFSNKKYKAYCVNLKNYLNNDSFLRAYFSDDNSINKGFIRKDDYYFELSNNIFDDSNDNVVCLGQKILFPKLRAKFLRVLGYGEDGNFSGIAYVEYNDMTIEEFVFEFSRVETKNKYEKQYDCNQIMWSGMRRKSEVHNPLCKTKDMKLFAICCQLNSKKPLKKIILPNIPNIHILAMTLNVLL